MGRPAGEPAGHDPQQRDPPWFTDPTENVKALVELHREHQRELRLLDASHASEMREELARRLDEKADLRAKYDAELRQAETDRINAIRAVDVGAVNRAAEVSATAAAALAAQLVATAEASRGQVAAAATASVTSLAAALEPIQKDIRDLRDAQSRGQGGKEQVVETRAVGSMNQAAIAIFLTGLLVAVALYAALHH